MLETGMCFHHCIYPYINLLDGYVEDEENSDEKVSEGDDEYYDLEESGQEEEEFHDNQDENEVKEFVL